MNKLLYTASIGLVVLLNACAPKPGTPEAVALAEKTKAELQVEAVKKGVDLLPDWCKNPPSSVTSIFACGIGESADLNISRSKAELDAKRQLGGQITTYVSGLTKNFQQSLGAGLTEQIANEFEQVSKTVTAETKLVGYKIAKSDIKANGGVYTTYNLMEYPIGETNKMVLDEIKKNKELQNKAAKTDLFKELENEIDKKRAPTN